MADPDPSQTSKQLIRVVLTLVLIALLAGGAGFVLGRQSSSPSGAPAKNTGESDAGTMATSTSVQVSVTATPTKILVTFTPTVSSSHASSTPEAVPESNASLTFLQVVRSIYLSGIESRDSEKLKIVMMMLTEAEGTVTGEMDDWEQIRRETAYALDTLQGSLYINDNDLGRFLLANSQGAPLVQPIDMTLAGGHLYIIDSGTLYSAPLPDGEVGTETTLSMTAILTPTASIDGFPVKEIVAVDGQNLSGGLYVLDKSNDIFFYDFDSGDWSLHYSDARDNSRPDPHFLNIATYANRLYLLDTSRNQIWRYPPNELGSAYLNSNLLWLQPENGPDVTAGVDLAVDGSVYILSREGEVTQYAPDPINAFTLDAATGRTHFPEWEKAPVKPISFFLAIDDIPIFLADPIRRRIVVLDRRDGSFLRQFIFADNAEFDRLHAIFVKNSTLYMLAGDHLYTYTMPGEDDVVELRGVLPSFTATTWDVDAVTLQDLSPNDPRVSVLLARYHLTLPNSGKVLPDQFVLYPGARRAYRYGVHQGMDLYYENPDQRIVIGSPVLTAGAGKVIRADVDYQEMSLDEVNALLAEAHARHITPPVTLDRLGGRQVWIDHGNGLISKYEHLSGIADDVVMGVEVKKGQTIGYVGLSGTPDGIEGNLSFPHLHFEIRIGSDHKYYLGQWLTIEDTRRILEALFAVESEEQ